MNELVLNHANILHSRSGGNEKHVLKGKTIINGSNLNKYLCNLW